MSSGSQQSDTQSSDAQSSDADTKISFNIHKGSINSKTGLGTFHLEMPFSEGESKQNECPLILLEIKDEDQMECLRRMKLVQHENVLALHFYDKVEAGDVRAFVEPYTGYVSHLFVDAEFFVNKETGLVPSPAFQEIVSASLQGLDTIIKNGTYHGNLSWETTVYKQDKAGRKVLKLCNFENRKDKSLLECQIGDCHGLAHCLEKVSRRVQQEYVDFKPDTCCLIDDLARRLRAVNNIDSLRTMKQENQDHVFFWDDKRKRIFCAYEMPAVWFRQAFRVSFQGSPSAPTMPWNTLWKSHALMRAMEKYRVINNIAPYNVEDIHDFLRLISGLYTHQIELKKQVPHPTVDSAVHLLHPRLLLDLKAAADNADNQ